MSKGVLQHERKIRRRLSIMVPACKPRYLRGGDQVDCSSMPTQAKVNETLS
jgi:hypothetical protein